MLKRSRRRQRAKSYFYGYSQSKHVHSPQGQITVAYPDATGASQNGLFAWGDALEIFEQVKSIDDFAYPGTFAQGIRANRQALNIRAKGECLFQVSNGNTAGAAWLEVYICKPRKAIPNSGIGNGPNVLAADVIINNAENAYLPDWNDARGVAIAAAGTGGVTNIMQNSTGQIKPTIGPTNFAHTPYMVPPFTENWKVVKQLKYCLPPGGQTMFKIKTGWRNINRQVYQKVGTGSGTSVNDWSIFRPYFGKEVFFRFHGQPAHSGTEPTINVNYGTVGLDVVMIKKYWYSHSVRPLPSYRMDVNTGQGTLTNPVLPSGTTEAVGD